MSIRTTVCVAIVSACTAGTLLAQSSPPAATPSPAAAAAEAPAVAQSRISAVTVYQNTALVTRQVSVPAQQGPIELVVSALPATTINSSLYSEGNDGLRVLTTRF